MKKIKRTVIRLMVLFIPISKWRKRIRNRLLNNTEFLHCPEPTFTERAVDGSDSPDCVIGPSFPDIIYRVKKEKKINILTTKHCTFIAHLISFNLKNLGFNSEIYYSFSEDGSNKDVYIVICPQMFHCLPEHYFSFQMEQCVSSRWFTKEYFGILRKSLMVLDYSLDNIGFLLENGLKMTNLYYCPVSFIPFYEYSQVSEKEYDVLFYGDIHCERRIKYFEELKKHFKVKLLSEVFGNDLYCEISKAKIIVNIHYYEDALLETTRLYECLSLKCFIISEMSSDISEHSQLCDTIEFVEVGDIDSMVEKIRYWLLNEKKREQKIENNTKLLNTQFNAFTFYFCRFLLGIELIDFNQFFKAVFEGIKFNRNFICLGLPESQGRYRSFKREHPDIEIFPGLRHRIGWVGCGMSYKFIMLKAKDQGFKRITVCEDDVEFKQGWEDSIQEVNEYLDTFEGDWDLFVGLIADFHSNTIISRVDQFKNRNYVHIDKMTSMVMNIYNDCFFDKLALWDEKNVNLTDNAIDRYIQKLGSCEVITTYPYIVGHKEEVISTLWGFQNTRYKDMILTSENRLHSKILDFEKERKHVREG